MTDGGLEAGPEDTPVEGQLGQVATAGRQGGQDVARHELGGLEELLFPRPPFGVQL